MLIIFHKICFTGSGKTFVARRLAEYLIKTKRRNTDRISEEFVCLFNFIEDHYAIETFFDNLSLRVKVVILDDIDPNSDYFTQTIKSRMNSIPNMLFLCVTSSKLSSDVS